MTTRTVEHPRERLTAKQEAFCVYLFQGLPQSEAYIKAGYSPRQLPATIYQHAYELANSAYIVARLRELQAKVESDAIGTVSERQKRLTEIYRANLTDFCDKDGNITLKPSAALAEVTVEERIVDGEAGLSVRTKRLKLRDPIAAIQEQNRMERIGNDQPVINNDNRSVTIIVKSEDGKQALEQLKAGKLPQLQSKG